MQIAIGVRANGKVYNFFFRFLYKLAAELRLIQPRPDGPGFHDVTLMINAGNDPLPFYCHTLPCTCLTILS